jgi:hypothetical protein
MLPMVVMTAVGVVVWFVVTVSVPSRFCVQRRTRQRCECRILGYSADVG